MATLRHRRTVVEPSDEPRVAQALTSLRQDVRALSTQIAELNAEIDALQHHADDRLAAEHRRVIDRATLAAIPTPRLASGLIVLEGHPSQRLRATRARVGAPHDRTYSASIGVRRCVTGAVDTRERWDSLCALEAAYSRDEPRHGPATILDVPGGTVALNPDRRLRISMATGNPKSGQTVAIPQFAFTIPLRKRRNVAHWLLDCAPQIAALLAVAPDAAILLPEPILPVHEATLSLLGVDRQRLIPWTGQAIDSARIVALESDGRTGGGRPLSLLMELRRRIVPPAGTSTGRRRRIYVSRRDAKPKRRWASNEGEIELRFQSRGFEIVSLSDYSLRDVARIFDEATVVAGLNGAGFAHILFSPPGTHLIMLYTDSLVRWHADDEGSRSLWTTRAELSGDLSSFGDSPFFFAPVAAAFGQTSHALLAPDAIPADGLAAFLDEALAQVESP